MSEDTLPTERNLGYSECFPVLENIPNYLLNVTINSIILQTHRNYYDNDNQILDLE